MSKKVIVYTKNNCGKCEDLKGWLEAVEIPYEVRNMDENPEYKEQALATGAMAAPVTVIGEEVFFSMNPVVIRGIMAALEE